MKTHYFGDDSKLKHVFCVLRSLYKAHTNINLIAFHIDLEINLTTYRNSKILFTSLDHIEAISNKPFEYLWLWYQTYYTQENETDDMISKLKTVLFSWFCLP